MDKIIDTFLIIGFIVIFFVAVVQYLPTIHKVFNILSN
jgi:hypothetical protein